METKHQDVLLVRVPVDLAWSNLACQVSISPWQHSCSCLDNCLIGHPFVEH